MSEVTDAPARTNTASPKRPLQGSHIWYELMTTDPDGAKAFYGKVVPGWSVSESIPGEQDYRMIERSDGGFAGGVFGLKQEQLDHGARPMWLGYIGVDDVDATVARIVRETALTPAAHLTCVAATKGEIDDIAREYWAAGVRHIVALRGDPPEAGQAYATHPGGYADAAALVEGLKKVAPFDISVAAYPECHPDSASRAADLDNLKRKIDAGADRAITQFFFSAECFLRFRDEAAAAGIDAEIVPGILPVSNVAQTRKFAALCGATIPQWMDRLFEGLDDLPDARKLVGGNS